MKIERLQIAGFGQLRGFDRRLSPGLNVFYGPNEAGKSTVFAFVRAVLFGFHKRTDPARYPAEGSRYGGELWLRTPSDSFCVQRIGGRRSEGELTIRSESGDRLAPSRLTHALGGVSRELFFQVFAFGLDELATFEALAAHGSVSEALFAAGMQGARRLPLAVEALQKSADDLFSGRGTKAEINRLLAEMQQVQGQLRFKGDRPLLYFEQLSVLQSLDAQLGALEKEASDGLQERDAIVRAEHLRAQLTDLQSEQLGLETERSELNRALRELKGPRVSPEQAAELKSVLASFHARLEQFRSLPGRLASVAEKRRALQSNLEALGPGLSAKRVREGDCGILLRSALETLRDELAAASNKASHAGLSLRLAQAARRRTELDLQAAIAELEGIPQYSASALRRRQLALAQMEETRLNLLRNQQLKREKMDALGALSPMPAGPREVFPRSPAIAFAGLLIGIALASYLLLRLELAAFIGLGALCISALVLWIQRRAALAFLQDKADHALRHEAHERARRNLSCDLAGLEQNGKELTEHLCAAAQQAELSPDADSNQLKEQAEEILIQLRQADLRDRLTQELKGKAALLQACAAEESRSDSEARVAEMGTSSIAQQLVACLRDHGFPENLSADRALQLWSEISHLRSRMEEMGAEELAIGAEQEMCARVGNRCLEAAGQMGLRAADAEGAAIELQQLLAQAEDVDRERRRLAAQIENNDAQLARLEKARQSLSASAVESDSGNPPDQGLASGVGHQLSADRLKALERHLAELDQRRGVLLEQKGGIRKQLEAWENDAELALLRVKEESIRAKLLELAREYAIQRLALGLLEVARRKYEREQQPGVIRLASQIFRDLTAGRYSRAYLLPASPRMLRVVDAQGRDWTAEQLSRGTREQLYLAFRLALIQDFGESGRRLPVLLDDILVNFDPDRTSSAVKAFARMSREQQVIAFTCHPSLRDAFQKQGAQVLGLEESDLPLQVESA